VKGLEFWVQGVEFGFRMGMPRPSAAAAPGSMRAAATTADVGGVYALCLSMSPAPRPPAPDPAPIPTPFAFPPLRPLPPCLPDAASLSSSRPSPREDDVAVAPALAPALAPTASTFVAPTSSEASSFREDSSDACVDRTLAARRSLRV
jgi:hypothetical protein